MEEKHPLGIQFLDCKGACGRSFFVDPNGALGPSLEPDQHTQCHVGGSRGWRRPIEVWEFVLFAFWEFWSMHSSETEFTFSPLREKRKRFFYNDFSQFFF